MTTGASDHRGVCRILAALMLGAALGAVARATSGGAPWLESAVSYVAWPIGQVFLRLLFLAVLPLVLSSLALGVCEIGDVRALGRVGFRTAVFTVAVSAISVAIGLLLVNLFEPGAGFSADERARLIETLSPQAGGVLEQAKHSVSAIDATLSIIPRNPFAAIVHAFEGEMPGVFCFALLVGVALATTPRERTAGLVAMPGGSTRFRCASSRWRWPWRRLVCSPCCSRSPRDSASSCCGRSGATSPSCCSL